MIAAAGPMPKRMLIGSRYTNDGIVCMTSSTGVTIAVTTVLCPIHSPSGMPTAAAMPTAIPVTSSRSMESVQKPRKPNARKEGTTSSRLRQPAAAKVTRAASAMVPSQPICGSGRGNSPR